MVPGAGDDVRLHHLSNTFPPQVEKRLQDYEDFKCGCCGRWTNSDYTAYTTLGPIQHLCWFCLLYYKEHDKLPREPISIRNKHKG